MPLVGTHPHLNHPVSCRSQFTDTAEETNLPECTQPSQNATPNPRRILPLRRRRNPDLHILHRQPFELAHQSVREVPAQRRPAG